MSKQIRIAEESLEKLNRIARETGKTKSLCTTLIVDLFDEIYEQLHDGGELIIEKDGQRIKLIPSLRPAKQVKRHAAAASVGQAANVEESATR